MSSMNLRSPNTASWPVYRGRSCRRDLNRHPRLERRGHRPRRAATWRTSRCCRRPARSPCSGTRCGLSAAAISSRDRRRILFAQPNCPHRHARNAEPALHAATAHERLGNLLAMLFVETFQRRDRFALGLRRCKRARQHGLAIHQHGAAAALRLRLTAVLWRSDAQKITQHIEQRKIGIVRQVELHLLAVDLAGKLTDGLEGFGNCRHGGWPQQVRGPATRAQRF